MKPSTCYMSAFHVSIPPSTRPCVTIHNLFDLTRGFVYVCTRACASTRAVRSLSCACTCVCASTRAVRCLFIYACVLARSDVCVYGCFRVLKAHRATDLDEKARIRMKGGRVVQGRVMGVLEPSRVVGVRYALSGVTLQCSLSAYTRPVCIRRCVKLCDDKKA